MASKPGDPRNTKAWQRARAVVFAEETHCHICYGYVDQGLPAEDPMSRTVDHLDALRNGGPLLPSRDRLRLAHRRCNTSRANTERARRPPTPVRTPVRVGECDCPPPCRHRLGAAFRPALEW